MDGGGLESVSLTEALTRADAIKEIVGDSPPVTIALYRLLLALLHRIYRGPKNSDEWAAMFDAGKFDEKKINAYFSSENVAGRFDLFDEKRPFYQSPSARANLQKGAVIQLYFQGKNNATLFEHTSTGSPKELTPAEAARYLVAFQGFDFGGIKADGSAQTAPLLQSAIALIRGGNLFETLMYNLHRYNGRQYAPFEFTDDADLPAWERDEETSARERWPNGYVDLLTWQSRRIVLEPEASGSCDVMVKNTVIMLGHSFPKTVAMHAKEPMMAFRASQEGQMFSVGFSESRALWRNSLSLLRSAAGQNTRPRTLDWLNELAEERIVETRALPIDFYGLAADKGKLLFWNHERFDLPLAFLKDTDLQSDLGRCLGFAEEMGFAVRVGIKALADKLSTKPDVFPASSAYWAQMESRFHLLLARMPDAVEAEMRDWFADDYSAAFSAFRKTIDSLSGSAAENRAAVEAENSMRKQINSSIKKHANEWEKYLPKFKSQGGNA